jgi:hypothetical protein
MRRRWPWTSWLQAGGERRLGLWRGLGLRCGTFADSGERMEQEGSGVGWGRRKAKCVVVAACRVGWGSVAVCTLGRETGLAYTFEAQLTCDLSDGSYGTDGTYLSSFSSSSLQPQSLPPALPPFAASSPLVATAAPATPAGRNCLLPPPAAGGALAPPRRPTLLEPQPPSVHRRPAFPLTSPTIPSLALANPPRT